MDFSKFVSLLHNRELFFPSQITLAEIDPLEGSVPKKNLERRGQLADALLEKINDDNHMSDIEIKNFKEGVLADKVYKEQRKINYIQCWHMNEHESAAMWSQYLSANEGIAITSTFGKLKSAVRNYAPGILIGKVQYLNYETDFFEEGNGFSATISKRKSYEHEKELRAVISDLPKIFPEFLPEGPEREIAHFKKVPIDINDLISCVYVSPTAQSWFKDVVEIIGLKYGLTCEFKRSDLATSPLF